MLVVVASPVVSFASWRSAPSILVEYVAERHAFRRDPLEHHHPPCTDSSDHPLGPHQHGKEVGTAEPSGPPLEVIALPLLPIQILRCPEGL